MTISIFGSLLFGTKTTTSTTPSNDIVDGTNGAERIDGTFVDADGDRVTSGADVVVARGGDDVILTGGGDDIVLAGGGDDAVAAGSGNDKVFGDSSLDTRSMGEDGVYTIVLWDLSDVTTSIPQGDHDYPFRDGATGESTHDVAGSTFTMSANGTPVVVDVVDNESKFDDGDGSQDLASRTTINSNTEYACDRITPEYAYSVQDSSGEVINIFIVEFDGNDAVGLVSDKPLAPGETYTFVEKTTDLPAIQYSDLSDQGLFTGDPTEAGDDLLFGEAGDDLLVGEGGDDELYGGIGDDVLFGDNSAGTTVTNDDGSYNVVLWDLSDVSTSIPKGDHDYPFRDGATGESTHDIAGSTFTLQAASSPVTVKVADDDGKFNDGDHDQVLAEKATLNGNTEYSGDRITPEYAYSVQNSAGEIINVFTVEFDGNDAVGLVSDKPLVSGETYTFVEKVTDYPAIKYSDLSDQGTLGLTGDDVAAGNDTLFGGEGNDLLLGEGGDDQLFGGTGNDTLVGDDTASATVAVRESFEWIDQYHAGTHAYGFTQDTGEITVAYNKHIEGHVESTVENTGVEYDGVKVDAEYDGENSALESIVDAGEKATYSFDFSEEVVDLQFSITDLDGDGRVQIIALDSEGNPVHVQFEAGGQVLANGDTVSSDGGYNNPDNLDSQVVVTVPGPVSSLKIVHDLDGHDRSGIAVSDLFYNPSTGDFVDNDAVAGDDLLDGGEGDDTLDGNAGSDTLIGGEGDDLLSGGADDDTITVGAGDAAFGEGGDDVFDVDASLTGSDRVTVVGGETGEDLTDPTNGGDGDTLDLRGLGQVEVIYDETDPTFDPVTGKSESGTATYTNDVGDRVTIDFSEIEFVKTDPQRDGIVDGLEDGEVMTPGYTDLQGDQIDGTDGIDDSILGNGGDDVIDAGLGNDTVDGGTGDDAITGGAGDDDVRGGDGADTLQGGAGTDTLSGDAGDDDILVGGGDMASGGTGDDVFSIDPTDPAANVDAMIDGGSDGTDGNPDDNANGDEGDILDLSAQDDDLTVDFEPNPETGTVNGLDADADTDLGFEEIEKVITGSGDDIVDGTPAMGPIDVDTGAGDDTVLGGAGDDTIATGDGNDTVDGGAGDDMIDGGAGSDTLAGGEGADEIDGGLDDDDIEVGAGDTARGGDGDDVFTVDPTLDGTDKVTVIGGEQGEDLTDPTNGGDGDTLDLRGLGIVDVVYDPTDPTFDPVTGVGESGQATYRNDAGEPVEIDFSEIEMVLTDPQPDGIVEGTDAGETIDVGYMGDPDGDMVDNMDATNGIGEPGSNEDSILGFGGDDTILAGDANDTVDAGTGDDVVFGGTGDDVLDGNEGDDVLNGDAGNDSIIGGEGSDTVNGGEGDDTIDTSNPVDPATDVDYPGTGTFNGIADNDQTPDDDRDEVFGGAGNDDITTGDDDDTVFGGTGDDTIDAGIDDDFVSGGDGDDVIIGSQGEDTLQGNDGNDTIFGGLETDAADIPDDLGDPRTDDNRDLIDGGAGDDTIYGRDDDDSILGGSGNDLIFGGVDDDKIEGGSGNDTIYGEQGDDSLAGNFGDDTIFGGTGDDTIRGNRLDDELFGGDGDDTIGGADGNDLIDGGAGNDLLNGGRDVDTIFGGDGNDSIVGFDGEDLLFGGAGDDSILGGTGDDTIEGGDGDDTILGQGGSDSVSGGDGDDVIQTDGNPSLPDQAYPGSGTVDDPDPLDNRDTVSGGEGNDTIRTGDDADSVSGGAGNDTINAGIDDDEVSGNLGDDTIFGSEGEDLLRGDGGDDVIYGDDRADTLDIVNVDENGNAVDLLPDNNADTIFGGDGSDTVFGGDDNDDIRGDFGNDTLFGGIDDDRVRGNEGDDVVSGGQGDDHLEGNAGQDFVDGDEGNDVIRDNAPGEPGSDLPASGGRLAEDYDNAFAGGAGDDEIRGGKGDDILTGDDDSRVSAQTDGDFDAGADGSDTIFGGLGNDEIHTGSWADGEDGLDNSQTGTANDTAFGGKGDDIVRGAGGDDQLYGDEGEDNIGSGDGADEVFGGLGSDVFVDVSAGDVIVGGEDPDDGDIDRFNFDQATLDTIESIKRNSNDPTDEAAFESGVITFKDGTTATFSEIEAPCFTPGTMIATPRGEVAVEDLRVGDKVITRDNGIQEIVWYGQNELTGRDLASKPHMKPILIKAGSLGHGLPERDMMLSPNHRVLVANDKTQLYFEEPEVLAAAKHMVGAKGVHTLDVMRTTYIHFMFERHEVVLSNGAWTESFHPGDYSLNGLGNSQRNEIFELFPELQTKEGIEAYQAARKALKKYEAKMLFV